MTAFLALQLVTGCAPRDADVLLECRTDAGNPIVDVIRLEPNNHRASLLSFDPLRTGSVEVTESEYVINFPSTGDGRFFRFDVRINRYTGKGEREIGDAPRGNSQNLFWLVNCSRRSAEKKL